MAFGLSKLNLPLSMSSPPRQRFFCYNRLVAPLASFFPLRGGLIAIDFAGNDCRNLPF